VARRRSRKRRTRKRKPSWTAAHVRRLFWRAGFGPTAEEVERWTARGRDAAIDWLIDGAGPAELRGRGPSADGKPLDPENEFGHDVLWWLDRMVRSTRPLEEKMTLFWHDHFATRDVETPLLLRQNRMLREHALGSFPKLLRAVTVDPAMQIFLSLAYSDKEAPNENYARELMELFTLGSGYSEDDVREAARALTGFELVRSNGRTTGVTYNSERHDDGPKAIFGRTGRFGWEDVLAMCHDHPNHGRFLVEKLWSFFIPTPMLDRTRAKLVRVYTDSGLQIAPVVRRILAHPHLYSDLEKPDMIKSPAVYIAGQLRTMGAPVTRRAWVFLMTSMGQRLFMPPSVAGWDWGSAWLSSNTMRARFNAANELLRKGGPLEVTEGSVAPNFEAEYQTAAARRASGDPSATRSTELVLRRMVAGFAAAPEATAKDEKVRRRHAEALQRALRHLLVSGPDNQLH
jgi:uncharacterized protein (DUF1800 family)